MKALTGLLALIALTALFSNAFAETIYVSGDASGVWAADSVIVTGEVRVPPDQTLIINPGTKVLFWTYCKFIIDNNAVLRAVGTVQDSIYFDEYFPGNHWNGLRFLYASDSCRLEYCRLSNGYAPGEGEDSNGGALYFNSCSTTVMNSTIDNCYANNSGGAVYCYNSALDFRWNNIINNTAYNGSGGAIYCSLSALYIFGNDIEENTSTWGGGIACVNNSSPLISENIITGNTGAYGGGLYIDSSNPTIIGNTINGNLGYYGGGGINCSQNANAEITENSISGNAVWGTGGGIYIYSSSPSICENTITGNTSSDAGGIYCVYASPFISENDISNNSASNSGGGFYGDWDAYPIIVSNKINRNTATDGGGLYLKSAPAPFAYNEICGNAALNCGGGMYLTGASPTLVNNTVFGNIATSGRGLYSTESSHPMVKNCIIWDALPDLAPQITQNNNSSTLITYSDISQFWPGTGNINADPLFISSANGDYRLLPGSPCIDAGDPDPMHNDLDGTRNDIGCHYYQYVGVEKAESASALSEFVLYPVYPNPFNPSTTISYQLQGSNHVSLRIYDLSGREVALLVNELKPAGSHNVTFYGSDLSSGIYFARLTAGDFTGVRKMLLVK